MNSSVTELTLDPGTTDEQTWPIKVLTDAALQLGIEFTIDDTLGITVSVDVDFRH